MIKGKQLHMTGNTQKSNLDNNNVTFRNIVIKENIFFPYGYSPMFVIKGILLSAKLSI